MVKIYCGPKQNIPDEYDSRGTRYQCLRKGIGVGLHLPKDRRPPGLAPDGTRTPQDPDREKKYCGNKNPHPSEYDDFATPYECLRKGVGVGLWQRYEKDDEKEFIPSPPPSPQGIEIILPENQENQENQDIDINVGSGACIIN